ncbi:MAG: hypothetical protein CNIPEHKO_01749 [Anaerolineales bacterium]|nr:hypothetical protein [Anaerolineae bacterium]MBL8106080.1 hypothetical protein [Anaerolineales bacterium]MBV6401448.1 hypothetical protein [Anaerolineales bacterium]MCC7190696.1 hypothetical protein [Anaerolineales bacterium]
MSEQTNPLLKIWAQMHSVIQEFWAITEPEVEKVAVRNDVPFELYLYSELGLDYFSRVNFQKRDPFTNPEKFEKTFAYLDVKGWIQPQPEDQYKVTEMARAGVKFIVMAGDAKLPPPEFMPEIDLERLKVLLKKIALANDSAPEPPEKWAILKRFRVADRESPVMTKIREYLLDLFAYRDDAHLEAARPHFHTAGIAWNVLGAAAGGNPVTADRLAEQLAFRGYDADEYAVALQAAQEIGWLEQAGDSGAYRISRQGVELREQVERQTDAYFFAPWSALTQEELDELQESLGKLREKLREHRKSNQQA